MLNNLILGFVAKRFSEIGVPKYIPSECINQRQRKFVCDKCVNICHKAAITLDKNNIPMFDTSACEGCKMCTQVCPLEAFSNKEAVKKKLVDKCKITQVILVGCEKSLEKNHELNCILEIPFNLYVSLAIQGKLKIDISHCQNCQKNDVTDFILRLKEFCTEDIFDIVNFKTAGVSISRRDFFKSLHTQLINAGDFLIDTDSILSQENNKYLKSILKNECFKTSEFGVRTLSYSQKCNGCKKCELLCPTKSIKITYLDNSRGIVEYDPIECKHCGICQIVCNEQAISESKDVITPEKLLISTDILLNLCQDCSLPLSLNTENKCSVCKRKRKKYVHNKTN
ncbi:hypothetical protein AN639_12950 [Candidatus Epulonipiscium fishelsonii]|uniref:Uncharacterized protein n=1 Tax=Candidatus Epulonipiscium fishelsonii TaxID=77094 RepID=A0ACC8X8W1_9FIRM|nr:hypothetical protein AN396_10695 [Epulopiscium sp. SCG-B11WGA-EpuloA1]ONI42120.1 hypothetical protein AN639_12950 [Epulopiscium sp. SCG-B05WGA-EpuloA1]